MATNKVLYGSTAITLDWDDVTGANLYQAQVATTPDFSGTLLVDDATLAVSTKSFTDTGTDNTKRWWRFRYSTDAGATWSVWREKASYWIKSGVTELVSTSGEGWWLIENDAIFSDQYKLPTFPFYRITERRIPRIRERNRSGDLLSEYVTFKTTISFDFGESRYINHEQFRELKRFHEENKTFLLATFKTNEEDALVPNVWKVQFESDPEFGMVAAGRQDLMVGTVSFEEI